MSSLRVVVVCAIPTVTAVTGVQRRRLAVIEEYRRAGHEVWQLTVRRDEVSPFGDESIVTVPVGSARYDDAQRQWPLSHLFLAFTVAEDAELRSAFAAELERLAPDVIHFEQPFMFLPLQHIIEGLDHRPTLVYGSQNVESVTFKTALEQKGDSPAYAEEVSGIIGQIESLLVTQSDLVVAVTQDDADAFRAMGAKEVVVARNGIDRRSADPQKVQEIRDELAGQGVTHAALFVGSDWPPNVLGFAELVGFDLSWMPPGACILVVGDVGRSLAQVVESLDPSLREQFRSRVVLLGRAPDDALAAMLELADVVVVPITSGGGSNLKTAEGILSGRRVVVTPFAMRGYDELSDLPQVVVAATSAEFRGAVVDAMQKPPLTFTEEQLTRMGTVTWQNCLPPMIDAVERLATASHAG